MGFMLIKIAAGSGIHCNIAGIKTLCFLVSSFVCAAHWDKIAPPQLNCFTNFHVLSIQF